MVELGTQPGGGRFALGDRQAFVGADDLPFVEEDHAYPCDRYQRLEVVPGPLHPLRLVDE